MSKVKEAGNKAAIPRRWELAVSRRELSWVGPDRIAERSERQRQGQEFRTALSRHLQLSAESSSRLDVFDFVTTGVARVKLLPLTGARV
jgi:hypothetical protein